MKCNSLKIQGKAGDSKKLFFKWKCSAYTSQVKHFEVIPYYYNGVNTVAQKSVKVGVDAWMDGFYYVEYTAPSPAVARKVCFQVLPWPNQYETGQWVDGKYYRWKEDYWQGIGVTSAWHPVPEYDIQQAAFETSYTNAWKAGNTAESWRDKAYADEKTANASSTASAAQKRGAAKHWDNAATKWANCAKAADTSSSAYAKCITAAKALGKKTEHLQGYKATMDALKKAAETARKNAEKKRDELLKNAAAQEAAQKKKDEEEAKRKAEAAAKKKQRDAMVAKAAAAWDASCKEFTSAKTYYETGNFGRAKATYQAAAQKMADSAYWYGEAVAYASSDDDKRAINQYKTSANEWKATATQRANDCNGYVEAQASLAAQQQAVPAKPSVSYTQHSASIGLDIDCSAQWSTELRIYRDVDWQGKWPLVHTIKRTLKKAYNAQTHRQEAVGAPWSRQRWYDTNVAAGHSYRYTVRAVNAIGVISDHSGLSNAFTMKPTRPEDLELKLAGYDQEGKANIQVNWRNTSNVSDEIQVQYTTWFGTTNAWLANALDKVTTVKANSGQSVTHTLTGIDQGVKLYVRVKAVNAAGDAWAYVKGGKDKDYATASINVPTVPEPPIAVPSGFKAAKAAGSSTSVTLTWTDSAEVGTTYEVQHSANIDAWRQNAAGDITREEYSVPGGSQGGTKTYTVTGLEPGKRYYRILKKVGDRNVWAQAAAGASRQEATMCVAELPAPPEPTVATPTNLTAAKSGDTSVLLTWRDASQAAGETYEVQYANYPNAFADNAVGDIQTVESNEVTSVATKRLTLTSLERGFTWYARVRKKGAAGVSNWTGTKSAKLPAPPAETIRQPTGLKLSKPSGYSDRITATWTDSPEAGATYTMRIAPSIRAYQNNALGEITETEYDPGESTADKTCQFEWTALEPGATYYVQAVKRKGELRKQAKAASGSTKADGFTAFLKLPEIPVPAITVPTNLTAVPRTAGGTLITEGDGDKAAVQVSWRNAQLDGETYEVSYTDDAEAFADNAIGYINGIEFEGSGGNQHTMAVTGLDRGRNWYFRVRKKRSDGQSAWTSSVACYLEPEPEPAEVLAAPTTVDTLGGYAADDEVALAWVHNSEQNSVQSGYQIEVVTTKPGAAPTTRVVEAQEQTANNVYRLDIEDWGLASDGTKVEWRVRTSGAQFKSYGPWSRVQSFKVFAKPAASVAVQQEVETYPFDIEVAATSSGGGSLSDENAPISYTVEIVSAETYNVPSTDGSEVHVYEGQVLFTRTLDARDDGFSVDGWTCTIGARDAYLVGGRACIARATVATAQGMRAQAEAEFTPMFDAVVAVPGATVRFDERTYTALVSPYCGVVGGGEEGGGGGGEVPEQQDITPDEREAVEGWPDENLHMDYTDGATDAAFAREIETREVLELREGTELSVYRIGQDGSVATIAEGLPNDGETACLDPHPDFGTCTYRIVAMDVETGVQSAYEAVVQTPCDKVVVQWDERWDEGAVSPAAQLRESSMLVLEHNVESAESYAPDAALRAYAGRSNPVSYYGTQKGQTARVSGAFIAGFEDESMRLFRMLAAWPGDCYVRTPSGFGCWANVKASLGMPRNSRTATATLEVTRVEGGR